MTSQPPELSLSRALDLPQAMEDLAAPAYVIDKDGCFRWVNDAYIELLGDRRVHHEVVALATADGPSGPGGMRAGDDLVERHVDDRRAPRGLVDGRR